MSADSQSSDSPTYMVNGKARRKSPKHGRAPIDASVLNKRPAQKLTGNLADDLCDHIATGGSLRSFCKPKSRPNISTVIAWLADPKLGVLSARYARARESSADLLASEIIEIADRPVNGDNAEAARNRLRVDARKWVAGKLKPKQWGDNFIPGMGEGGGLQIVLMRYEPRSEPLDVTPAPKQIRHSEG